MKKYYSRTLVDIQRLTLKVGHEQISELNGLVHMNARLYDNVIGRFLSADTIIQAPNDSQSYNRYSYVRNNPLMYTDPSGHSWLSKTWKSVKKHERTIVTVAIGIVIAIYAPYLLSTYMGIATGTLASAVAVGAIAGFEGGAIMTGSLSGAMKGAVFGAISGGVSFGIGSAFASGGLRHGANIFQNGKIGMQVLRAGVHGLSRGIISVARGGTFKSGFASGFTSSFLSPGATLGGNNGGGFTLRTSIASIVGGTASKLGGGKFSNGAVSGAFVHMFNAEGLTMKQSFSKLWSKITDGTIMNDASKGFQGLAENAPRAVQNAHPAAQAVLIVAGAQVMLGGVVAAEATYYAGVANPEIFMVATDILGEGVPTATYVGGLIWMATNTDKLP